MPDGKYRLQSVERALDALEFFALAGPEGVTLTELAGQLHISKSSAFALLQTLIGRGFAADSGTRQNRRYRLGMALAKLGDAAEAQAPLVNVATPILRSLTSETGLTTRLVVPDGPYAGSSRASTRRARCASPATSASGNTRTAPRQARRCSRRSRRSGPGRWPWRPGCWPDLPHDHRPGALLRDLGLAAARGYAIDDEEDADGVFCVGAAVHDRAGKCVAAISGTGLKLNRPTWRMDQLGTAIRDAADRITLTLGGTAFAGRQAR